MTQKTRYSIVLVSVLAVAALGIFLRTHSIRPPVGPELPAVRPPDLVVAYSFGVAMSERWSSAYLSEKQSYAEIANGPVRNKISFTMTPAELDTLYTIFRTNRFNVLTHTTQEVYDGSAGTISLSFVTTTVAQPMGDSIVMNTADQAAMDVVWQALQSVIQKKMAAVSVPIKLRTVGIPKNATVDISVDESPNLTEFPDAAHFVPGQHQIDVRITLPNKPPYSRTGLISIPNKTATLTVSFVRDEIGFTVR